MTVKLLSLGARTILPTVGWLWLWWEGITIACMNSSMSGQFHARWGQFACCAYVPECACTWMCT